MQFFPQSSVRGCERKRRRGGSTTNHCSRSYHSSLFFPPNSMSTFARIIIGLSSGTLVLASFLNSQLVWDAERFRATPQEVVRVDDRDYPISAEYNAKLKEIHTRSEYHQLSVRELSKFFNLVK